MDKQKICVIGAGGCGNKLLNTLMDIDQRYTPVFCNTNIREMENLEHFDAGNNSLYFANAGGTGRDRDKAKDAIKKEQPKTMDFLGTRFSETSGIDTFYLVGSSDGGTGSGSIPILAKAIKLINPDSKVNVLGAMSSLNEREASLRNTKGFWNDIVKLMKNGVIDSVQFIDNNKMVDEEEFNLAVMKEFDDSISINNEEIDIIDSEKANTARGYKVTLALDPRYRDLDRAIQKARDTSNFILPNPSPETNKFECDFLMATFDSESGFNKNDCKNKFDVFELDKYDYNDEERNIIVLGGVEMPKDYIELINMELEALQDKKSNRELFSDDLLIDNEETKKPVVKKKKKAMSRKQLRNLMNNTDLWD